MNTRILPLLGFGVLFALLGFGIWYIKDHNINDVPSPLIGKPAPSFVLPMLYQPEQQINSQSLLGKPYLLHVFASWCFVCREENPILMTQGKALGIPLIGFNYKDEPSDAKLWLQQYGNPYDVVIADLSGKTAINFGVYGAPESFLIDGKGIIRYKHIGAITSEAVSTEFLPRLEKMRQEQTK
jgi:cytochrome c biogenesis protein CcmG, thiol:disulfide interchange protein DsbE